MKQPYLNKAKTKLCVYNFFNVIYSTAT